MKKSILFTALLCALCMCSTNSQAQDIKKPPKLPAFKKGSSAIAIGAGFGGGRFNYYGSPTTSPLATISIESAFIDKIGIGTIGFGAIAGFKTASYDFAASQSANWYHLILAPRVTYHFAIHHAFDPYVGGTLGVAYTIHDDSYYNSTSITPYNESNFKVVGGVFVGAKYNLARWFGVFTELGLDISRVRIGINFNKLNR